MGNERCPNCDRPRMTGGDAGCYAPAVYEGAGCAHPAVDWRARALAAEACLADWQDAEERHLDDMEAAEARHSANAGEFLRVIEQLRAALVDACDELDRYAPYVPSYLPELARLRRVAKGEP